MRGYRFLTLAAATSLSACDMAPKYVQPVLPVPPGLPASGKTEAQDTENPADMAWQDFFTSPRLRSVIQLALDNNRDLRIALANVEQARALYRVQRSDLFPTLGVNASATYQDLPGGVPAAGGGVGGAAIGGRSDIYTANAGISAWEIDLFGRLRNLNRAALEQYFASVENRNAAQTALIAEVATAWLTLAADQERLRIAREMERTFGQTLELTCQRRSDFRPAWRSKSRPVNVARMICKGPRSGPFAYWPFSAFQSGVVAWFWSAPAVRRRRADCLSR